MVKTTGDTKTAIAGGIVGGIVGGLAIAAVLAVLALANGDVWTAFKGAGTPFLGARAAAPGFDLVAIAVGLASHMAVSIVWGVLFGLLAYGLTRNLTLVAGLAWGIVVWVGMHYLVLPAIGLGQIATSGPVMGPILQHLVFGLGLGVGFMPFQRPRVAPALPSETPTFGERIPQV